MMKLWCTTIRAIDPRDGIIKTWAGPDIKAPSREMAEEYCQRNELGYCKVEHECIMIIPCDDNLKADWDNAIDFNQVNNN